MFAIFYHAHQLRKSNKIGHVFVSPIANMYAPLILSHYMTKQDPLPIFSQFHPEDFLDFQMILDHVNYNDHKRYSISSASLFWSVYLSV